MHLVKARTNINIYVVHFIILKIEEFYVKIVFFYLLKNNCARGQQQKLFKHFFN